MRSMIKVTCSTDNYNNPTYLDVRNKFVKSCIAAGNLIERDKETLRFKKNISNDGYYGLANRNQTEVKIQLFKYCDEYNKKRYYTVCTYIAEHTQACGLKPYESLGFHSDKNGNPLCEDRDPFNNGDVNNTGVNFDETHYATIFDLKNESLYFWDEEFWGNDDED